MRVIAVLAALVAFILCSAAHAAEEAQPPMGSPSAPAPPPEEEQSSAEDENGAASRAELSAQAAELEKLRTALEEEKRARENPALRWSGYVQVDWVVHHQASQEEIDHATNLPLNQDRFVLRRGRMRVDAGEGMLAGALELDVNTVNGPQVRPVEADISLRWPGRTAAADEPFAAFTLGLMRIPFGAEIPEGDSVRLFLERSTAMRALFPGQFDLGARLAGRYRFMEGAIALMNGSPIGDKVFPAVAPVKTKDVVGRLGIRTDIVSGVRVEMGASAEAGMGLHEGTPTTKEQVTWRDDNGDGLVQATEIRVIPGSSATPSAPFSRFAMGADARLTIHIDPLGDLALRGEIVRAKNLDRGLEYADPIGAGYDLRELGFYLGATQEITDWVVVGARYDRYNPDHDASERLAVNVVPIDRSYSTWAFMAMVRYKKARLVAQYDKNGNALGRDATGAPTTLRSDTFTLRGQLVF